MTGTYWLLTYQVSRNNRASWETWNAVTEVSPAVWLLGFCERMRSSTQPSLGYTDVVLLNGLSISEAEYILLNKALDQ